MKAKKFITTLMAGVLTLGLVGCSSTGENKEATSDGDPVKLTFGIWDAIQEPGMKALADKFTEKHPNIDVEVQVTPWEEYWTKMEAAATGGELPDVFWMHTNEFLKYASNDMLMDVTDLEGTDGYKDYPESLVQLATYKDKVYGVPKDFDTVALVYNKELFDQAGIAYPDETWDWDKLVEVSKTYKDKVYGVPKDFDTVALVYNKELFDQAGIAYPDETWDWDKLVEVSKQLTDKEKGIYGFSAALEDQQGYLPPIAQAGGYVLKDGKSGYTDTNTIKGLQFYVDLANKHGVSPTLAQLADTHTDSLFQSGKVAMSFLGSWRMSSYASNEDIKDKFDVAVLPKGDKQASVINGLSFAGNANSKHPEETKLFLEFLASQEAQDLQAELGAAISARNGSAEKWVKTYQNHNVQVFLDMKEYSVPVSTSLTKAKWGITEKDMIKKMMTGEISVEEGAKVIADEMDKLLATEK